MVVVCLFGTLLNYKLLSHMQAGKVRRLAAIWLKIGLKSDKII